MKCDVSGRLVVSVGGRPGLRVREKLSLAVEPSLRVRVKVRVGASVGFRV